MTPDTDGQRWSPPIEDVLDPVFGRMGVPPMIVVIPDGTSRYGCGQWVDSPVTGNFEQYVVNDVVAFVDAHHRTIPDARSRGVFGFSSGGFGAWNLASRNPDVFGAMAVLSADSFLDMTHKFMPYKYLDSIWPEAPDGPIEGNFWSEIVYDYAACYSPNPDRPPLLRRPPRGPSQRRADPGGLGPLARASTPSSTCTTASTISENCPASCSTPAPTTTTTCTGATGSSVTTSTKPGSRTSTERTPATTAAEQTSATRWRCNGCRKSWNAD